MQTLGFYRDTASPVAVDVTRVLEDVLCLYGRKMQLRHIQVSKQFRTSGRIIAFAGEIRQVFANLIGNALDAMANGGELKVRVSKAQSPRNPSIHGVRISIGDTGGGIAPEHKQKIFEPFFTTKRDIGTGLGLWLSKNLVEHHGGWLRVCSRTEGERTGSVFSVFLPEIPIVFPELAA